MEITEEMRIKAKEAMDSGTWRAYRKKLREELEEQYPEMDIKTFIINLKNEVKEEKIVDVDPFADINKVIKLFFYNGKKLTIETLRSPLDDRKITHLQKPNKFEDIKTQLQNISNTITDSFDTDDEQQVKKNLKILESKLVEEIEIGEKISYDFAGEITELPLGKWENRKKYYDYWKEVFDKHEILVEKFNDFATAVEKEKEKYNKKIATKGKAGSVEASFFDFIAPESEIPNAKKINKLRGFFTGEGDVDIPNYILELGLFDMAIEKEFYIAMKLIKAFLITKMNWQEAEEVEPKMGSTNVFSDTGEQARHEGFMTENLASEVKGLEVKTERSVKVQVDPIFWLKYNDEYEEIQLPTEQMQKVKELLIDKKLIMQIGDIELEEVKEFENWVEKWIKNNSQSQKVGPFYLPLSNKLEKEWIKEMESAKQLELAPKIKAGEIEIESKTGLPKKTQEEEIHRPAAEDSSIMYGNLGGTGVTKTRVNLESASKLTKKTEEFLEFIHNTIEEINSVYDVYFDHISSKKDEPVQDYPAIKLIASQGKERLIPKGIEESWHELLKIVNEYYLLPISKGLFVDEKPKWSSSNAYLSLSKGIDKMTNKKGTKFINPIGAILDKSLIKFFNVDEGEIQALLTFLRSRVRGTSPKSSTLLEQGKEAVEALNQWFGKQFEKLNEISILKLIYDANPEISLEDKSGAIVRFWGDLPTKEEVDKEYKSNFDKLPILDLKHAMEIDPALKPYGMGRGEVKGTKTEYALRGVKTFDKDIMMALRELDEFFNKHGDKLLELQINKSLLKAHDTIRKMENKPIIKGYMSLTNIEHMDNIINKVYDNHKVGLTGVEIDGIVKEVSSYDSIAKSFGVNEEIVYTVKAMFR